MAFVAAGTATNYLDLMDDLIAFAVLNGWTLEAETEKAASAVVAAGGTGYSVSDQLTLDGGAGVVTPAVFNVDTEAAGVVTSVSLVTAGHYDYVPANPAATTGGGGSGCTLTVTYAPVTTPAKTTILRGIGSGADEIYVSIRANDFGVDGFNWQLRGHTGFQADVDVTLQPNTSAPAYVPLDNGNITYWFFVTGRRIICVFRIGSTYTNMYLGFLNPFGTAASYPYPLVALGCASLATPFSDSTSGMGGLSDPMAKSSSEAAASPGYVIDPGGTWKAVKNSGGTSGFRPTFHDSVAVFPAGTVVTTGVFRHPPFFQPSQGAPAATVGQLPDSGAPTGFRFPLFPAILHERVPVAQILGELDNVRWAGTLTEGAGQAVSEDVYDDGVDEWILFQNVNRTDHWSVSLVKRE